MNGINGGICGIQRCLMMMVGDIITDVGRSPIRVFWGVIWFWITWMI